MNSKAYERFVWFCRGANVSWLLDLLVSPAPIVGWDFFFAWAIAGSLLFEMVVWSAKKLLGKRNDR